MRKYLLFACISLSMLASQTATSQLKSWDVFEDDFIWDTDWIPDQLCVDESGFPLNNTGLKSSRYIDARMKPIKIQKKYSNAVNYYKDGNYKKAIHQFKGFSNLYEVNCQAGYYLMLIRIKQQKWSKLDRLHIKAQSCIDGNPHWLAMDAAIQTYIGNSRAAREIKVILHKMLKDCESKCVNFEDINGAINYVSGIELK